MYRTEQVKHSELKNGDRVFIQGYLFKVNDLKIIHHYPQPWEVQEEYDVVSFRGVLTSDIRNDGIRNTVFNGGTYGGNADCYATRKIEGGL